MLNRVFSFLNKNEKLVSYLVAIACLIPLFQNRQFLGLDAAAHQHNSFLINELIFNSESPLHEVYEFNSVIVPNYTGHVVLSFFMLLTDAATATKLMLFVLGIFTFASFRSLLNAIQPGSQKWSWFVLPLFWNTFLHFGFYNFLFSIPFAMVSIAYVLYFLQKGEKKYLFVILFSLTGLWFSHVSVFFVVCLVVLLITLFNAIQLFKEKQFKLFFIQQIFLFILFIPFVILTLVYFKHFPSGTFNFIDQKTLVKMFLEGNALMSLTTDELYYINYIVKTFLVLIFISVGYALYNKKYSPLDWIKGIVFLSLFMVLYFLMPDSDGKGGYMSVRLLLIIYFSIVVFLTVLIKNFVWMKLMAGFILVGLTVIVAVFKQKNIDTLSVRAVQVEEFEQKVEPYSAVFVFEDCDNWLLHHYNNLIGIKKPVVIYENYECQNLYFPLVWKNKKMFSTIIEVLYQNRQLDEAFTSLKVKMPDYILFCTEIPERIVSGKNKFKNLDSLYSIVHANGMGELYKLKSIQR